MTTETQPNRVSKRTCIGRKPSYCETASITRYSGNFSLHSPVRLSGSSRVRLFALALGAAAMLLAGCGGGRRRVLEVAYVAAPQAALRDQVSAVYNRVGNVKNGERVEVVDHEKRFARV